MATPKSKRVESGKVIPIRPRASVKDQVVELAFVYWRERFGLQECTPRDDLVRAEREIRLGPRGGMFLVRREDQR